MRIYNAADSNTLKDLTITDVGSLGDHAGVLIERNCDYNMVDGCTIIGDYYGISLYSGQTDGCEYTVLRNNRILDTLQDGIHMDASTTGYYHRYSDIYNNMISGSMVGYGMYLSHVGNDELYFNSIYNTSGGGLYLNITSGSRRPEGIKNNVVKVTGSGELYAVYMQSYDALPNADAIDYNDWYAPSARVGYMQGLVCQNLVAWQDATSRDYNSISHEPYFTSGTDLHIQTFSPCQRRGIYLDLFPADMDGQSREYTPDMGADENLTPMVYLDGTYPIYSGGSLSSLNEAVEEVFVRGVEGPVVFEVYNGIYTEQVGGVNGIAAIPGADAANRVTFRVAEGQQAVIEGDIHCIYISGGDYLTFEGFILQGSIQDGVKIYNAADNNTLKNLTITDVGSLGDYAGVLIERNCDYTTVDGCSITGDYYGISLYSSHTDGCDYTVLRNNWISIAGQDGIHMDASTTGYYHRYSDIYNNMIAGSMDGYGMYLSHAGNDEIYFNSVNNEIGGGLYLNVTSGSRRPEGIKNNVVKVIGSGELYAVYMQSYDALPAADAIDYNDWYAPSARVGYMQGLVCQNLVAWQDATSRDYNSISHEPYFVSDTDLHIQTFSPCQRRGIYLDLFATDMDGQSRELPPDMGADENLSPLAYMEGTYPVFDGGSISSFGEAVEAVFVRGVEGPVVFEVYTDTYVEQVGGVDGIGAIPGAGAANTITFREVSGHEVVIEGDTHCIFISGGDYLTFEGFTLQGARQDGVRIYNAADYNTLRDLTISDVGTFGDHAGVVIQRNCDYTTVDGCTISGDYYGISLYSSHTDGCDYTVLSNNRILDALQDGIHMNASTTGYYHRYTDIYNNMVSGSMEGYGMYLSHAGNDEIYFNSVRNDLGGGMYLNVTSGSRRPEGVKNNVVQVTGSGELYAVYMQSYDALPVADAIDYNDWYAPSASVGYMQGLVCQSLAEWRDATSRDYNSISAAPQFMSASDLHLFGTSPCIEAGVAISGYTTDIDGEPRANPPDIGADEAGVVVPEYVLELDASYGSGRLNLSYRLGTPEPAMWSNYLLLTNPTIQIIPLWVIWLPIVYPPLELPISFPYPSAGLVAVWTDLHTAAGFKAFDYDLVDTGTPGQ